MPLADLLQGPAARADQEAERNSQLRKATGRLAEGGPPFLAVPLTKLGRKDADCGVDQALHHPRKQIGPEHSPERRGEDGGDQLHASVPRPAPNWPNAARALRAPTAVKR
jgi:hypothetical protein